MAHDLIPPPSPAGKPEKETFRLRENENVDAELEHAIEEERVEALPESSFRGRFGLVTGTLVGIGIAALAVLVLVLANDPGPEPKWSAWQPQDDDPNIQLIEISRYVPAGYRLDDGDQLNKVDAERFEVDGAPGRVVVRTAGKGEGANIQEIDGETVLFTLKGLGPHGSIDAGEASEKRLRLLEREATELALYAFKYVDRVDNVVAVLPPPPPETPAEEKAEPQLRAMLFRPGDLEQALKAPLETNFPQDAPRPGTISQAEVDGFELLAQQHEFDMTLTSDQLGTLVMVLDRTSASDAVEELIKASGKA